ncbi:glutathione-disulfide reductase [Roseomonas alkaliterrae]|uniref:Glutathione reductase (NADPH) n=1 Tax=Neoroseomonas alkaliterrae TaxID=1452450 RepID=A0A840Y2L9_9PROT|nr:glutathione-disulfide reductase [Neoroseomonas alkaliterrae]MBB5690251.1 glutathione reductase (NADPH) [Neoroseomonas alkaliterrae]MBR0676510.1 glutathione-disulfide reductase [Neoroseomonas alkaliterrae]
MAFDFDLFVIGGGSGGVRCARIAAGHGARVGVAEERFWGGTCVNVGCVPKKIMVNAAEYGAWAQDASAFGWDIAAHGHDWAKLAAARDAEVARLSGIYAKLLAGAGVATFDARARFLDAHTLDVGGRRITAERIVIATGGTPTRLPIPGAELGLVSDDLFTLKALPRRAAVIGAGYIAVEFASILRGLGAQVELLYRAPLPLRGFDEDIRAAAAEALAASGIALNPDVTPTRIARIEDHLMVALSDGSVKEVDAVFFCTGRAPNTAGLGLDRAGVATTPSGAITVDEEHRTSVPHIHAIGDVLDRVNLTPMATAVGHALADTLFGNKPRRASYENVPTAVFMTPPIGTVGLTEAEAAARGPVDVYVTHFTPMRHTITKRAGRRTLMKLVVCQRTQKVLGAHMLGEDAAEIMQGIGIAVVMGATKQDFDRTIGIHPTAAEEFVTLRTRTRVAGVPAAAQ